MIPSVGKIVHYRSYGTPGGEFTPECRAAIITEVPTDPIDDPIGHKVSNEAVHLFVANPTGLFLNQHVPHDEDEKRGGTWHWVEQVE